MAGGTDLRVLFEELDAERTFNLIDAILVDDAMYGANLDKDGLEKLRTAVVKSYGNSDTPSYGSYEPSAPSGLHAGQVLVEQTDEDGNFEGDSPFAGLREAPLG